MQPTKATTRGATTAARYGAGYVAARAREGQVTKALAEANLDPSKMKPEDYAAFRRQVFARSAAKARAVLALKRAVIRAEREAMEAVAKADSARAALAAHKDGAA